MLSASLEVNGLPSRHGYPEAVRIKTVQQYQQRWQESGLSIDKFAEEVRVHHTTIRQWLKKYAPDFYTSRKSPQFPAVSSPIDSMTTGTQQVQVETEWYEHHQMEIAENTTARRDPDEDRVAKLLDEIAFLKEQVAYWMRQEPVRL